MKEFITAWQFLTRIRLSKKLQISEETLTRAYIYFPLVGFFIGAMLALLGHVLLQFFKPLTVVILVVIGEIIITGGLHLDGFMDSCDGLFSGRERERILEIMKDSRVGSMGVIGLLILMGLKIALCYELIDSRAFLPVLATMPVFSRWVMVFVLIRYPYARSQGLGSLFRARNSNGQILWVSFYSAGLVMLILPWQLSGALILAIPFVFWVAGKVNRILAGHTGDTYGFMNEISGLFFLLAAVLVNKFTTLIF